MRSKKICLTPGCSGITKKGKYCNTCYGRRYRLKYPYKYAYQTLKDNAKRRKKLFTLTFDEFKEFAKAVDYLAKKGITAQSMHIDRIEETGGYTKDNIQPMQNRDNIRKYLSYYWDEQSRKMIFNTETRKDAYSDTPF